MAPGRKLVSCIPSSKVITDVTTVLPASNGLRSQLPRNAQHSNVSIFSILTTATQQQHAMSERQKLWKLTCTQELGGPWVGVFFGDIRWYSLSKMLKPPWRPSLEAVVWSHSSAKPGFLLSPLALAEGLPRYFREPTVGLEVKSRHASQACISLQLCLIGC